MHWLHKYAMELSGAQQELQEYYRRPTYFRREHIEVDVLPFLDVIQVFSVLKTDKTILAAPSDFARQLIWSYQRRLALSRNHTLSSPRPIPAATRQTKMHRHIGLRELHKT